MTNAARTISPIPTFYAGVTFRSRLEARWAVFFDVLDVPWRYEPEGFQCPSGWYLPDFWLPHHKIWLEIKGAESEAEIDPTDLNRWHEFAAAALPQLHDPLGHISPLPVEWHGRPLLAYGDIPNPHGSQTDTGGGSMLTICDTDYKWTVCPLCNQFGATYNGRIDYLGCDCSRGVLRYSDDQRLVVAYGMARSARFASR